MVIRGGVYPSVPIWIWIHVIRELFHTARAPWRVHLETISTLKSAHSPEIPKATSCSWDLQRLRRLLHSIIWNRSVDQTCRRCCRAFLWALRHKKKVMFHTDAARRKATGSLKSRVIVTPGGMCELIQFHGYLLFLLLLFTLKDISRANSSL